MVFHNMIISPEIDLALLLLPHIAGVEACFQLQIVYMKINLTDHIHMYAFGIYLYPKRYTLHSRYTFIGIRLYNQIQKKYQIFQSSNPKCIKRSIQLCNKIIQSIPIIISKIVFTARRHHIKSLFQMLSASTTNQQILHLSNKRKKSNNNNKNTSVKNLRNTGCNCNFAHL